MIDVDVSLATQLIAAQFPQWADMHVRPVETQGWDNRTFRIGNTLKAKFPRAAGYAAQAEKEARWLPAMAPHLPVRIPAVLGVGKPGEGYPFAWSVQAWIDGDVVGAQNGANALLAKSVANFLSALRRAPAGDAPPAGAHNFHRGGDLAIYDAEAREALQALGGAIDTMRATVVWREALATRWDEPAVWVHGDVAMGNVLARDGALCAVIDFGCLGAGDPACDLTLAWTLFTGDARTAFREGADLDTACWARARGWALWKAMVTLARDAGALEARRVIANILDEA